MEEEEEGIIGGRVEGMRVRGVRREEDLSARCL